MAKGISLHLALNKVDKKVYNYDGSLNSCFNNAKALASICIYEGFEKYKILHNEEATRKNFIITLKEYAQELYEGDIFLISFSGHGGQQADTNFDEITNNMLDKNDETWCFFDGRLVDDELYKLWGYFRPEVRVIVISDSCHSGTIIKSIFGEKILSRGLENESHLQASVVLLSACQDEQESGDGKYHSTFITQLLRVWDWGKFKGTYSDFISEIGKEVGFSQRPSVKAIGKNTHHLLMQTPFKI